MSAQPQSLPAVAPDAAAAALRAQLLQAIALHQRGELDSAIAGYGEVLAQAPRQFDALRLLGAALRARGLHAEAVAMFDRALAVRADFAEVWLLRGESLVATGRADDALASIERAVSLRPDNAPAWSALGLRRHARGEFAQAIDAFDRSLAIAPGAAAVWSNRGLSLDALRDPARALQSYERALAVDDGIAEVWCNHAKVLADLGRHDDALESLDAAIRIAPGMAAAWGSRATPLRALGRYDEALETCAQALARDPHLGPAWAQQGATLAELGRYAEAVASFEQAMALDPADALARFNASLLQLTLGRFEPGWDGYEAREGMDAITARYGAPIWDGAVPLAGKVIAVHCEQGLGDTLQFCRYAPLLAEQGARVVLTVPTMLQRLLGSLGDGVQVVTDGDTMPAFDLQCLLLSLPHRLRTRLDSIPGRVPYLAPPGKSLAHWRGKLGLDARSPGAAGPPTRRRVGVVCSGSAAAGILRHRSLAMERLAPLIAAVADLGVEWHLLQKELRDDDQPALARLGIVDHRAELADFSETAALAACMDAVVSVDTAVAHLAGALGRPLFLLLHAHADWRWMVDRRDSPWYPTAQLFRQQQLGDWSAPLDALVPALRAALSAPATPAAAMPAVPSAADTGTSMASRPPGMNDPVPACAKQGGFFSHPVQGAADFDWRDDEQLARLQEAARADPDNPAAQFNLGLRLLALGRFDPGWDHYEWRVRVPRLYTPMPEGGQYWDGSQDLAGKTLLLCHEQGLGDVIQFSRFVPCLARHGARILLGVPPALARLLGSVPGVAQIISGDDAVPPFDLKCLLLSAAQRLGIRADNLPAAVPYLAPPPACANAWRARLGGASAGARPLRIGVAASGSATHSGDALRSLPLARLCAALALHSREGNTRPVELHLLQNTVRAHDEAALLLWGVVDHRAALTDMAETAALIGCMDLVVSVDTAVAHLAGALGVPLFVLLPADPDWRWLLGRGDSPWYPGARLLRCAEEGAWDLPLAVAGAALLSLLQARESAPLRRGAPESSPEGEPAAPALSPAAAPLLPIRRSTVQPPDLAGMLAAASARHRAGERAAAIAAYQFILAHDADLFDAQRLLGAALFQEGRAADALPVLETALALREDSDEVWSLHGNCRALLGEPLAAIASLERARALRPDKAEIWNNLGRQLQALGRVDAALAHYERAVALDPARPQFRVNRALLRLAMGDFAGGWSDWEARLQVPGMAPDVIVDRPQWDGRQTLAGRTLLLVCEQGLGDTIQFARYAPLLAQRGAKIVLGVPPPLRRLMTSLGGGVAVVSDGDPLPAIDLACPLLSLARIEGTRIDTIAWTGPYLHAAPALQAQWVQRLALVGAARAAPSGAPVGARYGLVFSGNPDHASDASRSIALERLAPLLDSPAGRACQWHLLQKDVRATDEPWLARLGVHDHRDELGDLADTAALAAGLDGVVSVDTAVAHLAGALGLPLFLLLAFNPDWRWMLQGAESPWYPRARLFRQATPGDWSVPIGDLAHALFGESRGLNEPMQAARAE
jgi:tetratricopeptide (TPR) repeat protein